MTIAAIRRSDSLPGGVVISFAAVVWTMFLVSAFYFILHFQDDAFIHLRYAENLLKGQGVFYNEGQPSYGTSSPLYLYLLAALMKMGVTTFWTPKVVSLIFHGLLVAQFLALVKVASGRSRQLIAVVTLLLCMPMSARWLNNGMETSMIAMLATWLGLYAVGPHGQRLSFPAWLALSFLACTIRIEFFAMAALVCAILWLRDGTKGASNAIAAVATGAGLSMAHYLLVFGHITPDTAIAKAKGFSLAWGMSGFAPALVGVVSNFASATTLGLAMFAIMVGGVYFGRRRALLPVMLTVTAFLGLVFLIAARDQAIQGVRYFVFIVFFFTAFIVVDSSPAKRPDTPTDKQPGLLPPLPPRILALLALIMVVDAVLAFPVVLGRSQTTLQFSRLPADYRSNLPCVGYDIGYITYFTKCRIYDMSGLVNGRHAASTDEEKRIAGFSDTSFKYIFVNKKQLDVLAKEGVINIEQYREKNHFSFPNVGTWITNDNDVHTLYEKISGL